MRRSLLFAQTYLPNWIQVIPCPARDSHTNRDNWQDTDQGRQKVYREARNIISYIREGSLPDFTI